MRWALSAATAGVLALAGCGGPNQTSTVPPSDLVAANTVVVDPMPKPAPAKVEAYRLLAGLPARVVGSQEIAYAHRPGRTPFHEEQKRQAVADNEGLWPELARLIQAPAAPETLQETGGAAARDFLPVGLLAAWRYQLNPGEDTLRSLVDTYQYAVRLAEEGALVHAKCAHEVVIGLDSVQNLPVTRGSGSQAQLQRFRQLVSQAPRPSEILDRERVSRLNRFAEMYRQMATVTTVAPEQQSYFLQPKQPILDARNQYWKAWVQVADSPNPVPPPLPEILSGEFSDGTESAESMQRILAELRLIREVGDRLLQRLSP